MSGLLFDAPRRNLSHALEGRAPLSPGLPPGATGRSCPRPTLPAQRFTFPGQASGSHYEGQTKPASALAKAGTKLLNTFYVQAEVKIENGTEFYRYSRATMLQRFSFEGFLRALEEGKVLVDFDARTGHNHGTKFRLRQNCLPMLYKSATLIFDAASDEALQQAA